MVLRREHRREVGVEVWVAQALLLGHIVVQVLARYSQGMRVALSLRCRTRLLGCHAAVLPDPRFRVRDPKRCGVSRPRAPRTMPLTVASLHIDPLMSQEGVGTPCLVTGPLEVLLRPRRLGGISLRPAPCTRARTHTWPLNLGKRGTEDVIAGQVVFLTSPGLGNEGGNEGGNGMGRRTKAGSVMNGARLRARMDYWVMTCASPTVICVWALKSSGITPVSPMPCH